MSLHSLFFPSLPPSTLQFLPSLLRPLCVSIHLISSSLSHFLSSFLPRSFLHSHSSTRRCLICSSLSLRLIFFPSHFGSFQAQFIFLSSSSWSSFQYRPPSNLRARLLILSVLLLPLLQFAFIPPHPTFLCHLSTFQSSSVHSFNRHVPHGF